MRSDYCTERSGQSSPSIASPSPTASTKRTQRRSTANIRPHPAPAQRDSTYGVQPAERDMRILMVLTSHDTLGDTGRKTGFWLEEFASPYYVFLDAGAEVVVASPKGGQPPLDPKSDTPEGQTEMTRRFKQDRAAQAVLANTRTLSEMKASDYDAVFYPGGHGPM